jgi:hypothetical protein
VRLALGLTTDLSRNVMTVGSGHLVACLSPAIFPLKRTF